MQGGALFGRAGVLWVSMGVQSAFVADANGVLVVTFYVRPFKLKWAGDNGCPVAADVVVVARHAVAAATVLMVQRLGSEDLAFTGGATVDDDVIDSSHVFYGLWFSVYSSLVLLLGVMFISGNL